MVKKYERERERRGCRARILRMLKKKKTTVEELMTLYQEKNIFLFKGHHEKELYITLLLEGNAIDVLTGNVQNWSSLHQRIIRGTIHREGSTLEEFGKRKLHKDVRIELGKMIQNEKEQNKKQEEKETTSMPRRRWNVAVRLMDKQVHLMDVIRLTGENHLILSNRTFCEQFVTRDNVVNFSNKATCRACLRENVKRDNREK